MSTVESIFWNVVGYAAMPVIYLVGFIIVAVGSLWILSLGAGERS